MPSQFEIAIRSLKAHELEHLSFFFKSVLQSLPGNTGDYIEQVTAIGECIQLVDNEKTTQENGPFQTFPPGMKNPMILNNRVVDASDPEEMMRRLGEIRQEQTGGEYQAGGESE